MDSSETISYTEYGFDNSLYLKLQSDAILERMAKFSQGTLYLEIGGKFLYDPHGARVLPGFDPRVKVDIIKSLAIPFEIIFCINARDILSNRMLTNKNVPYIDAINKIITEYSAAFSVKMSVAINLVEEVTSSLMEFREALKQKDIPTFLRYVIPGYPDPKSVTAENGFAKDEYITTNAPLVLVIGPASNSGKMSTCLGQIYHDEQNGKDSGYAKFELFPIWNLPLKHPVNLAYEAATADIGDYNLIDYHHKTTYNADAVNYNRDVEAFPIITGLLKEIIPQTNYMQNYHSPTDMGMNKAGFAISNDSLVAFAAREEITRRKEWFKQQALEGRGDEKWVTRCEELEKEAEVYINAIKQ